jgi:hypothetical protein
MTAPHADQLIEGYIARLNGAAGDIPKSARQELISDVRTHIDEARARDTEETDATVLNILDRLGEPAVVVAEMRERLGLRIERPYRPGLLEVAAVILLPFVWPVGVILIWMSPAWHWRDKLIGTLIPPGGYMGLSFILLAGVTSGSTCGTVRDQAGNLLQSGCTGPPELPGVLVVLWTLLLFGSPLITATYLALRLRWGRRMEAATA